MFEDLHVVCINPIAQQRRSGPHSNTVTATPTGTLLPADPNGDVTAETQRPSAAVGRNQK